MSDDFIDLVKNDENVKKEICSAVQEYNKLDLSTKEAIGRNLLISNKVFTQTMEVMGDTIYDISVENDALRDQIGKVNEEKVKDFSYQRKAMDTKDDKNKIILNKLSKTLQKSKAIY